MRLEPDRRVTIEVTRSECPLMKTGDVVYLKGPLIDYERSAPLCLSALVGIYPWVMTARFGIESAHLGHDDGYRVTCPDGLVQFRVAPAPEAE
jgi:uncharacterized repeat protein (TIGR04076 family)